MFFEIIKCKIDNCGYSIVIELSKNMFNSSDSI